MRLPGFCFSLLLVGGSLFEIASAQSPPDQGQSPAPPQASTLAQKPGAVTISLDEAIQMALQHNHNLMAARTTPAALSTGIGSDTQKPFAIVIVAGLVSRLFLGFFVNPVLYEMVARDGDVLKV